MGRKKKKNKRKQKLKGVNKYWGDRLKATVINTSKKLRSILNSVGSLDQSFINACIEDFNELMSTLEDNILAYHLNYLIEGSGCSRYGYSKVGNVYRWGGSLLNEGRGEDVESSKVREW